MDTIFGPTAEPELFHAANGLLLSGSIEEMFESGFFVIVPDLPDNPKSRRDLCMATFETQGIQA
jgi:hypothetical protein